MTTTSPILALAELARERPISKHSEYMDRSEPRSSMAMDYTTTNINGNNLRQHYSEEQQHGKEYNSNNNGYSHYSSSSSSSSASSPPSVPSTTTATTQSHYQHGSTTYLPPPIQTGNGNGLIAATSNATHSHGQTTVNTTMHNSFTSPTSPALSTSPLSPNGTFQQQQQQVPPTSSSSTSSTATSQQQQQGHYEYDQYHSQSYHAHHAQYPQDHHQHPLSPNADGNGAGYFYQGYPIPEGGRVDSNGYNNNSSNNNGTVISNGSYSSSSSSSHYPRNHSYGGHHGSIDDQPDSPVSMPFGSDGLPIRDPNVVYSTSAPSPLLSSRSKRRSEVFASHESPHFYPAQQNYNLFSMDQSTRYNIRIAAKIDRGFFLAQKDWTCYRRNYFQISASFSIQGLDTSVHSEVPCLVDRNGELVQINKFSICIGAQIQNGEKAIELVQHTPKRDKGPQITPRPTEVRAGGDLSLFSAGSNPNVVTFERVQFKTATANNGKRRAAQQYYQVHVDLFGETALGELILVASSISAPLVVRGRSPGHYADNDDGTSALSSQPMDGRYYRNDSISSNGGPMSVNGDYPYYPNYSYGPSYQYQSLGSASHMTVQSQDPNGYYERHGQESYPTSPLSPGGARHHPYMAPQIHHGFSPAPTSPDVYSPPSFIGGAESPNSFNRISQDGHYYGTAYSQYPQQQQQDQYQDDHEAQMARLRIHSPTSSSSPTMTGISSRRQSFSSSMSKKGGNGLGLGIGGISGGGVGPIVTRKSRSISMSAGITKRTPSKTRTSRTVPVSPTKELSKGLGISTDRIPEEELQS